FFPGHGGNALARPGGPHGSWCGARPGLTGQGRRDGFRVAGRADRGEGCFVHGNCCHGAQGLTGDFSWGDSSWERAKATKTSSRLGSVARTSTSTKPRSVSERSAFTSTWTAWPKMVAW